MPIKTPFLFLLVCVSLLSNSAKAQFQIMPSVNLLTANGSSSFGGSLSGRYFVSPHLATGVNLRYLPEIDLVMTTLEADYFLLERKSIRPYLGVEAGLYSKYRDRTFSETRAPGIGPKLGFQYKLTPLLDLQLDAGYPIAIRKGESFGSDSGLLLGAGLNFTFGNR